MQYALKATHSLPMYRSVTYILVPTVISFFCIGVGWLIRATLPGVYAVLTGSRGMAGKKQQPVQQSAL
jgi:hypothetical protein